jgi:hypothetical protein
MLGRNGYGYTYNAAFAHVYAKDISAFEVKVLDAYKWSEITSVTWTDVETVVGDDDADADAKATSAAAETVAVDVTGHTILPDQVWKSLPKQLQRIRDGLIVEATRDGMGGEAVDGFV